MTANHFEGKKVFVLIPAHNRRIITLACLHMLSQNGDIERCQVVVIDDGSTDGTADAIKAQYPSVQLLRGDGNLWWTGAISKGMEYAHQQGADYFIWLNDDTLPAPQTLNLMIATCAAAPRRIVTAQCYADQDLTEPTYGGRLIQGLSLQFLAAQPEDVLDCDVCSGNLVCLPRSVVKTIGYPPARQAPQTWGDVVYTWQAKQAGFEITVLGAAIALCSTNPLEEGWSSSDIPMWRRWQMLSLPKSSIYPPAYWYYCRQVYGLWGMFRFVEVYLKLLLFTVMRLVVPLSWIVMLKNWKNSRIAFTASTGHPKSKQND